MIQKHPRGVLPLLIVHILERFGFWGLRSLLTLYLIESFTKGGLGWDAPDAIAFEGLFAGVIYFTPIVGGYIADRWLGYRTTIFIGNIFISIGVTSLAIHHETMISVAMIFMAIGNGFFKPCVTSMLGTLYPKDSPLREQGYHYLFQTVLIGVMGSSLICGWILPHYGFVPAFIAAGTAPAIGAALFFVFFCTKRNHSHHTVKSTTTKDPLTHQEKKNMAVIAILSVFAIVFFAAQAQGGGLLAVYIHRYTDHYIYGWRVPTIWLMSFGTVLGIGFVPLYNAFWRALQKKNKEPDFVAKFIIGILATATSFAVMVGAALERRIYGTEQSSMYWLVAFHTAYVTGKLLVIPLLWATAEKLAPERYRFIIMGIIIGCISAGNIIGGQIGALIEHLSITTVFVLLSSMCIIMAAILALVKKRILTLSQS